jgi:hypothetical protein
MWSKAALLVLLVLVLAVGTALANGSWRWRRGTEELRARLTDARRPIEPATYDPGELEALPAPVQAYFRNVLTPGQPMIAAARVTHEGTFNVAESGERWTPFTSQQLVVTQRPGFDWDARVRMAPGVTAFVRDAYVAGEGILYGALFGLVPVVDLRGTPEVAQGELMRFFAEAGWYPTALLPSQGVRWEPIDAGSARASLTDGATTVTFDVYFDDEGMIARVRAAARYRTMAGAAVPMPWEGRVWGYEMRHGMRVPLHGEVAWLAPEGRQPYWRGRITSIEYEFAS